MTDKKKADLAGPGIGDYTELEKILPLGYQSALSPKETQLATARARPSSSTSRTTETKIRWMPRSSRPPPSGNAWP
jgi:hypothetical protein